MKHPPKTRYLYRPITEDAFPKNKLVFISGPRQVGKSTLAKTFLSDSRNYYTYDNERFRRAWAKDPANALADRENGVVVLDEIHKDRLWKRKLKGIYDQAGGTLPIVVTGSARLDTYRRGSDSLLGRYLPYRLHPFTVGETKNPPAPDAIFGRQIKPEVTVADLIRLGGFPEPLFTGEEKNATRWSRLRLDRLVQEDTRDLLAVSDLNAFRLLADLLPERVGSALSINALREDVGKAYATVRSWYQVLEALYFCVSIKPYSQKIIRAVRSEPKMYLFDLLRIPSSAEAQRLENLTALHLLKACHFWTDTAQGEFSLHYVRDKQGREVDFLVVRDRAPWMLIECKSGNSSPSPNLRHFANILKPPHCIQLVRESQYERNYPAMSTLVISYDRFLAKLP